MTRLAELFAAGHAGFIAAAFTSAFVLLVAELLLLRRRVRRSTE